MPTVYTQDGEEVVVDILDGTVAVPTYWIGHGTGSSSGATKSDTALINESTGDGRSSASLSQPSADINQFLATITANSSETVSEAGVFDSSAGGNLLIRSDFSGIALSSGDKVEYTFQLEQT